MTVDLMERKSLTTSADGMPGLRLMVLGRVACDEGATRPELARELAQYVGSGPASRLPIETELAQLVRAGSATESRSRFNASADGLAILLDTLHLKSLPKSWSELRDNRLVAVALGLHAESPARLKGLGRPDVLRSEIVIHAFGLPLKGNASSTRLRAALALVALERAFGNGIKSDLPSSSGLNPKASRVLAGQLLAKPRDAGTDKRLIAMLAAEAVGSAKLDADQLRAALLRRFAQSCAASPMPKPARSPAAPTKTIAASRAAPTPAGASGATARPPAASRPDLPGFVKVVQKLAARHAEGWPGNRKALVSRVFGAVSEAHPGWGLTLVEFKAMLAECHRIGALALVTADLKDKRLLDELRQSTISYKNTVWHLVRVED